MGSLLCETSKGHAQAKEILILKSLIRSRVKKCWDLVSVAVGVGSSGLILGGILTNMVGNLGWFCGRVIHPGDVECIDIFVYGLLWLGGFVGGLCSGCVCDVGDEVLDGSLMRVVEGWWVGGCCKELVAPKANGSWLKILKYVDGCMFAQTIMVHQCHHVIAMKLLAIPEQTATGKETSNMFMAGSLPKTTRPT
ncbi:hypothetical protein Tco_1107607 [Tanacetum coccineum]